MSTADELDLDALLSTLPGHRVHGGSAVLLHDREGHVVSANTAALAMLDLDLPGLQELAAHHAFRGLLDEDGQLVAVEQLPTAAALSSGSSVTSRVFGLPVQRAAAVAEGREIFLHHWVEISAEPLFRSADEGPYGVLSVLTEVRDPRLAELQLADARRVIDLLERTSDLVMTMTADTTIIWVSPACVSLLGQEPADVVGRRAIDLLHPDDLPVALAELDRVRRGDLPGRASVRLQHAEGAWVWTDVTGNAVVAIDGELRGWQASFRDVRDRVEAERRRDESLLRLQLIMRHSPIGLAVAGPDGRWSEVNDALCSMLGYQPEQLLLLTFADITHPDDVADTQTSFQDLIDGRVDSCESEKRYLHADGSIIWAHRVATIARRADGSPAYFVAQMQDITDRKHAQEQLASLAVRDPMTGLPTRLVLHDRMTRALAVARRDQTEVAVLAIDVRPSSSPDDHELATGEDVLQHVAARLHEEVREQDTAVHLGGEEFVVLCEDVSSLADVEALAGRLRATLERPYPLGGGSFDMTVSIGVTLGHGPSPAAMLAQADAAVPRPKQRGRAGVAFHEHAALSDAVGELGLERELRPAIDQDELVLHYQPILDLQTSHVRAREALLRWDHSSRGLLLPGTFLQIAERSRLIVSIGSWALDRACEDALGWADEAVVHVNVSSRHFARPQFAETVAAALVRSGLAANRLCIEITETSVLHASSSTTNSVEQLHEMGVSVALDDFGTGQSSISALHRLPIDSIKIDQSFVADVAVDARAADLVTGLLGLGHGLGIDVVAEGVETSEQADWLDGHGCLLVQGYLYGRPAPVL